MISSGTRGCELVCWWLMTHSEGESGFTPSRGHPSLVSLIFLPTRWAPGLHKLADAASFHPNS